MNAKTEGTSRTAAVETLTHRQKEILRLISQHMQAKEVARELNISERTVKTHTDAARKRLGVASSRDAARLLAEHDAASTTTHASAPAPAPADHGIVPEDRWPSGTMAGAGDDVPVSAHEHTVLPQRTAPSGVMARPGDRLAEARSPRQAGAGHGYIEYGSSAQPGGRAGDGGVHDDRGDRLVDRRWAGLERRLAALTAIQWLGLIAIVGVLAAVLMGGLIAASLGTLEAIEELHRQTD